jgi:uncharacterized protein YndB with AHSA1/START domain
VPTARASRTITLPLAELWEVIGDPHHLPRWWPRVTRVEDVGEGAFTEVMSTSKGRLVRADFDLVARDESEHVLRWAQRLEGTPFARVLSAAETEVRLTALPAQAAATDVAIELRQVMRGFFARFGAVMVRRAATATLEEALNGLERISG